MSRSILSEYTNYIHKEFFDNFNGSNGFAKFNEFNKLPKLSASKILESELSSTDKQFLLAFCGHLEELKSNYDNSLTKQVTICGINMYHMAVCNGHIPVMEYLENKGFNIHAA